MPGWNIMAQASACKTRQFRLEPEGGHVRTGYPYKSRVFASCAADLCFLIQNTSQLRRHSHNFSAGLYLLKKNLQISTTSIMALVVSL
jgi:hypothetical protein